MLTFCITLPFTVFNNCLFTFITVIICNYLHATREYNKCINRNYDEINSSV